MLLKALKPRLALNKAFLKVKPIRTEIEAFKQNLIRLLDRTNETESEEFHKNLVSDFLKETYYRQSHFINTKGRNDLVIHNGPSAASSVGVIIEAKKPTNRSEMVTPEHLNAKAFQELVLYYLRERITHKNLEVKHLIITNINEWYLFDATIFDRLFAQNKTLVRQFQDFEGGRLAGHTTDFFYREIAQPFVAEITGELEFTHFDLRDYRQPLRNNDQQDDNTLIALFKLLSPEHLLKLPFTNDSNSLDKRFYTELLHLIGLVETKSGGKKLISRHPEGDRNSGSLLEDAIIQLDSMDKLRRLDRPGQYGATTQERLFNVALELSITWINRILFLKLLEAQLVSYHKGDKSYAFLNIKTIRNYDDLNSLFFQVLARRHEERNVDVKQVFERVPYLNSSLFEPTEIEQLTLTISNLKDEKTLPIITTTVLKNEQGKKRTGQLATLEYLFEFLNAYDFSSEGAEDIQEDNKTLINASVLGLIFEKINGYKDGSFFTPGFITMYMCRETIRRAVVQKFNESKGWECENIPQIYDRIGHSREDRAEANDLVNSLKICDPAVGSGHFLVSALNELIAVKNDLRILQDREGQRLKEYQVEVVNDELIITDEDGAFFEYNPRNRESQRIMETLFHEKQRIIEGCLFGVDINPNSVKICRLRLWIELLKNAYYKNATELETLPNIDINIKCGNSLVSRFAINADLGEALKKSKWTIDSYRLAVDTYRNAESKEQKREMEQLINSIKTDFRSEITKDDPKLKRLARLNGELFNLTRQDSLFEMETKQKALWNKQVEKLSTEIKKLDAEIEEIKANKIYDNAFEWRFEFPEVLNDAGDFVGFDVVIGNPPYGSLLSEGERLYVKNNYNYLDYQFDIYMTFCELGFHILKQTSILCFIIPNTWLLNLKTPNIRKLLLSDQSINNIRAYTFPIFEEAVVDTVIIIARKLKQEEDYVKVQLIDKESNSLNNTIQIVDFNKPININMTNSNSLIYSKLSKNPQLYQLAKITQGTKPFQIGKGKPKQDELILQTKPFVKTVMIDNTFRPLLRGSLMNRYIITWKDDYFISFGEWLAEPRYSANYDAPQKIVIRQTGSSLIATFDNSQFIVRDNLYTIITSNPNYSNYVILGCLNSRLLTWYYQNIVNNEVGEALAQVKSGHLKILPMPQINFALFTNLEEKVIEILKANISNKTAEIAKLENQIDMLVYQLYELTEEEIIIVEGT